MAACTVVDDSSKYFQAEIYDGAGSNQQVTFSGNSDLQPDLLWIKRRNAAYGHNMFDTNRGIAKLLEPDNNNTENTNQTWISGVGSDSFTIGVNEHNLSNSAGEYVAWAWHMNGGTTSSNSDGGYDTTVLVDQDAGQSIVTYTGTGGTSPTATTIGHGLGAIPKAIIIRARNRTEDWHWFHHEAGTGGWRGNEAEAHNDNTVLGDTMPTSSVYKLGTDLRMNGGYNYVAYCFAEVQGYSRFGAYYGNGQHIGAFVYTGFKPALIIVKQEDSTEPFVMFDNARNPFNETNHKLFQHSTAAEDTLVDDGSGTFNMIDVCSNGFKCRHNSTAVNGSGIRILYWAWAENPFVTSGGVPGTAK